MKKRFLFFTALLTLSLTMVACGSSNISPVVDVPNGNEQEENAITEQIENSNSDSSVDSTSTPEAEPTEKPSATLTPTETITPEPTEEPASTPTPEPSEESTEEPTATPEPTETPEAIPTETPVEEDEKKEPSSGSTENSSVTPTPSPTPTTKPVTPSVTPTPSPTPSVTPIPTTKPSGGSNWSGGYDNLPTDGFDHIKVPTKSDFYDEGFDDKLGAFDFDGSDWSNEWWDAYQDFLVANGSPIDSDGNPMGAFNAIHDGSVNGYQYLYYGVNWSGSRDGWGDIALYNSNLHPQSSSTTNYKDAYFLETTNFFYGEMDKGVENEYRAATTMMLSWIVPNPQEVEKAIYEFHVDKGGDDYEATLTTLVKQHGYGSWVQIGEVDVAVVLVKEDCTMIIAIREHH